MAGIKFTSPSQAIADKNFNGGLNSTSGPLSLNENESSSLQNIDFNKFGSILKRNGYLNLNSSALTGTTNSDGLFWYEYVSSGSYASLLVDVTGGKIWTDSNLGATFTDQTGTATVTAGSFCEFENWLNSLYITNNTDTPSFMVIGANAAPIPSFQNNSYTFQVVGITNVPAVADTYTNNGITYTVKYVRASGTAGALAGQIVTTGSGAPTTSGTLTRTSGAGDATISFNSFGSSLAFSANSTMRLSRSSIVFS